MGETSPDNRQSTEQVTTFRSLRELVDMVTGRQFQSQMDQEDAGLAEHLPFPFLALVGQAEMKLALLIAVINPMVSGVLLVGPRGTGKTTAVRSLVDLLPVVRRSACYYGCLPEDIEASGLDAVCPECARKYGEGLPLTKLDRAHLVELPLNAQLEDVIGGWDERAQANHMPRLRSGILKQADLNVLYIDEVNLLDNEIVNAILDASAQGIYTVRRGSISSTYRSRFALIGSMNPEEGHLRPQIMDRFGLRVIVRGLPGSDERLEAYRRSLAYRQNPQATVAQYADETGLARDEIQTARDLLPRVTIPQAVELAGTQLVQRLGIDSLRAEISLFEAARGLAAAAGRSQVNWEDIQTVAPMALRLRRSAFMIKYINEQSQEEKQLNETLKEILNTSIPFSQEGNHGETE